MVIQIRSRWPHLERISQSNIGMELTPWVPFGPAAIVPKAWRPSPFRRRNSSRTLASLKEGAQRESIGLQPTAAAGRTGGETFHGAGCELGLRLTAFRGRRHSDRVGDATLGLLAEYVVA